MSLPSIKLRVQDIGGHVMLTVFVGPDAQHRAYAGVMRANRDEADAIIDCFAGSGYEIERTEVHKPV